MSLLSERVIQELRNERLRHLKRAIKNRHEGIIIHLVPSPSNPAFYGIPFWFWSWWGIAESWVHGPPDDRIRCRFIIGLPWPDSMPASWSMQHRTGAYSGIPMINLKPMWLPQPAPRLQISLLVERH